MEFVKRLVVIMLMVMGGLEVSMGVVYKVGDSVKWTTLGHFNYTNWASSKNFHVGDIILFEYSPTHHNVLEVNDTHYQSCDATAPIVTHATGNDSIILTNKHYYFLCGFPGHCQLGQKVDIKVANGSSSMAPSPNPTMTPPPPPSPPPPRSSASLTSNGFLGMLALGLAIVAGFGY